MQNNRLHSSLIIRSHSPTTPSLKERVGEKFFFILLLFASFQVTYSQYQDTVFQTDSQQEMTFSFNWDHTHLTSVSELRDSNLTLNGWSYLQFKQYDENLNIITEKRYTDSVHFVGGHRSLTFFEDAYYFPKTSLIFGEDTTKASVVKFDTLGNIIWEKEYYTNSYKSRTSAIVVQNNQLFVYGYSKGTIGVEPIVFILKIDTSGNIIQSKTYSSTSELTKLLSVTSDGGFLMFNEFFNFPVYDTKIYKLDANLNTQWVRIIANSPKGTIVSGFEAPDGSVIYMGSSKHPLNETERSYIGKLSANGTIIKDSVYDFSNGYDAFGTIGVTIKEEDGFYCMGAHYEDIVADTLKRVVYYFDYDLNLKWRRKYAKREGENTITYLKTLDNNFILAAGYVFPDASHPTVDEWFMVVDSNGCETAICAASIDIENPIESKISSLHIYPNPANTNVTIENGTLYLEGSYYEIYNSIGQLSQTGIIHSSQIDISKLPEGFYIFVAEVDEKYYKSSLIISR